MFSAIGTRFCRALDFPMGSPKEPPKLRVHVVKLTVVEGKVLPFGDHMSSRHQASSLSGSEGIGIVRWSPDMFGATGEICREFWIYIFISEKFQWGH